MTSIPLKPGKLYYVVDSEKMIEPCCPSGVYVIDIYSAYGRLYAGSLYPGDIVLSLGKKSDENPADRPGELILFEERVWIMGMHHARKDLKEIDTTPKEKQS